MSTRLMYMTEGEQLVWAATFAQALAGGSRPPLAVRLATRAVQRLREVDAEKLLEAERTAVEQMRGVGR